jgi:glycerophosphoryl diester phosphodiesterase
MSTKVKRPLIIAHRGSSASAPENTFAAFSQALADKTEGIEFDVRITRDGVPVVFHDASLKRIAGDDTRISSMNLEELNGVDAGSWFNSLNPERADLRFIGERIPTLEAVLEFLEHFAGSIYIELKGTQRNMKRLAAAVGEILKKYVDDRRLIVKSFQLDIIPMIVKICPGLNTAALFAPNILRMLQKEKRLVKIASELNCSRLSIHFSLATKNLMRAAANADMPVTIWTADNPLWIKRSLLLGIDSVITNEPARLIEFRNRSTAAI